MAENHTIVFLRRGFLSFCGRVSKSRARLTRKNSRFPPSFARFISLIRKMRTAHFRGNACKNAVLPRFIGYYLMCPQHRNVCEAPLCGSMSKHFTRSFVAQRFRAHFTFLPRQKHFTFRRLICSLFAHICNAEKFHVCSGAHGFAYRYCCAAQDIKRAASRFYPIALAGQVPRSAFSNRSTTLYQTQKLTFKFIRTFAFSPQVFYPIYFIINFYFYIFFFFYFFFYIYLEKKKGCGGEEEGGTQCFTRLISP